MTRASAPPALRIDGLTVAYESDPVLWDIDLELPAGCIMGVVGPNGAGKSTLLLSTLGLLPPLAGRVEVFGQPLERVRHRVAYVPQRRSVDWDFPATVMDVVLMGTYGRLGWFRRPGKTQRAEAMAALELVEMVEQADSQISELSGGQQQRIFLARAFVQHADLLMMDEPFAGVDAKTERAIVRLLHGLRDEGKTLLVVHHDLATVPEYFDQVALLNRKIVACGPVGRTFTDAHVERTYGGSVRVPVPRA
ncbi:MAG: metal ABC transporter ATP-binding protein [Planctomycetota bacterium]|nr:metal ABC transporter ATP-binding protein [Planctomycetota bacterium]